MSRATRFAARDPGPAARVSGFLGHLRENGLKLGVGETGLALAALAEVEAADPAEARLALKTVCAGCREEAERFDDLFDAYWMNEGRVRVRAMPARPAADHVRSSRSGGDGPAAPGCSGAPVGAGDDEGEAETGGTGRLVASRIRALSRADLRELVTPEDSAAAEAIARKIGEALRDRRSRRRRAARRGDRIDIRRALRMSLSTGGEPLQLPRRRRPDRSVRIVALCDVSGSMAVHARVFLAFLAGLMRADAGADAYLFHTRLIRVTEALREKDALRALARLSLMAEGFGGGSRIGMSLSAFARGPARRCVDGRTAVLILSDGYDADPPEILAEALSRLKRRGARIIWLNPLKGWRGYAPTAAAMAAALPHLDLFRPAGTLADLEALAPELARL